MVNMIKRAAADVIEALKQQPLSLTLVVINILFLLAGMYALREVSKAIERKDQLLTSVAERCLVFSKREN